MYRSEMASWYGTDVFHFFKIIPKSNLVEAMENAYNNPVMELSRKAPKVVSIDNSQSIKSEHYAKFKYSNNMVVRYKDNEEERDVVEEMETLQSTFGEENVTSMQLLVATIFS